MNVIELPAQMISSITFRGPDLRTLSVTAAKMGFDVSTTDFFNDTSASAGSMFMVTGLDSKDLPDRRLCL